MNRTPGKRRFCGPGTILALLFLVVILVSGAIRSPNQPERPARPATQNKELPPLWKPEPQFLLDRKTELALDKGQVERLEKLQADWARDKAEIERDLGSFGPVTGTERATEPQLKAQMEGYSEVSRAYDAARSSYWNESLKLLSPSQVVQVEELKKRGARP